jgi:hypothetical protein
MAFPDTVLDTKVELQIGESYAYCGAAGQEAETDTYGHISSDGSTGMFDITGDIDIRIDVAAETWTPLVQQALCSKNLHFGRTTADLSWLFSLQPDGTLQLTWGHGDGSFANKRTLTSSVAVGASDGTRKALRVTLLANNGFVGCTATFYTAATLAGPWSVLGTAQTSSPGTSIAITNSNLEIGTTSDGKPGAQSYANFIGKIYGMDLFNGINGVQVAGPRFDKSTYLDSASQGTTTFVDFNNNTWTMSGSSVIYREYVDVTSDVQRDHVEITRGRPNEGGETDPATCTFQINNANGKYSPRNPNSPYYKKLTRNTNVRVSLDGFDRSLVLPDDQSYAFCRDSASTSTTSTDLDIAIEMSTSGIVGRECELVGKGWIDFSRFSYKFRMDDKGYLFFQWSPDGTTANMHSVTCDALPPLPSYGRIAFRVIFYTGNPYTVRFFYSNQIDGVYAQLGSTVTGPGSTSIYDGTTDTYIGGFGILGGSPYRKIYSVLIKRNFGTTVASPDFTDQDDGTRHFTDGQGNVWYIAGLGEISSRDYRFYGELVTQPPKWDATGNDNYIKMKASGILRRLNQGQSPLKSTMYRGLTTKTNITAYWPCEDGKDSTSLTSGLVSGNPMDITQGSPTLAASSVFNCSSPLPQLHNSTWTGSVANHANTGREQIWFLLNVGTAITTEVALIRVWFTGATAMIWQLYIDAVGNFRLIAVDSGISLILDSGTIGFDINTRLLRVSLSWFQDGPNIAYEIDTLEVGQLTTGASFFGTLTSATLGKINRVDINQDTTLDNVVVGHISATNMNFNLFELKDELNAFDGEAAGNRIRRLFAEEKLIGNIQGDMNQTTLMGPQLSNTLLDLLREAEIADGGILFEPRDFLGLTYRTRESMYSQDVINGAAKLVLSYTEGHISSMDPTDDDQYTKNQITASKKNGGISLASLDNGSELSIGVVGIYDAQVDVNVHVNSQLIDIANWFLALGTVNEARFPAIELTLERKVFSSNFFLTFDSKSVDIGDLVTIGDLPSWLPPETISQLVQGLTESLHNFSHMITIHGAPAAPWQAGIYEDTDSRYESEGSFITQDIDTVTTAVVVNTPNNSVWSDDDAPFDIIVNGERMTVTAISGTGTPQVFTCTRHVNGIIKSHVTGEEVRLFRQVRYGF